jgi:excisionase family DNA binding protein
MVNAMSDRPIAVTVACAAKMIGVSHKTVRNYARDGRLQVARLGRRVLVPVSALELLIRANMRNV